MRGEEKSVRIRGGQTSFGGGLPIGFLHLGFVAFVLAEPRI